MLHEEQDAHNAELRAQNEVKKLMLEVDHDARFFECEGDIPAEIESQFLDNVRLFEDNHKNAKRVTVFQFLGEPKLRNADEIPDDEIVNEYQSLIKLLEDRRISFAALTNYPDEERLFYKFITEELFAKETDDFIIPGYIRCFTYEEFVPNHEYDIRNRSTELVEYIFNDMRTAKERFDEYYFDVNDFVSVDEGEDKYQRKISPGLSDFFMAFPVRRLISSEIKNIEFVLNNDSEEMICGNANVNLVIHYTAITEKGDEINFTGTGNLKLELQWEWWRVVRVELPGLRMG